MNARPESSQPTPLLTPANMREAERSHARQPSADAFTSRADADLLKPVSEMTEEEVLRIAERISNRALLKAAARKA